MTEIQKKFLLMVLEATTFYIIKKVTDKIETE